LSVSRDLVGGRIKQKKGQGAALDPLGLRPQTPIL
jgi:hypothetical protein